MTKRFIFILIGVFAFNLFAALPPEYETLKAKAEKVYWERPHIYAKVNNLYGQVALANLPPAEQRWVRFRLADTQWRMGGGVDQKRYAARVKGARDQLQALISDIKRVEDRDEVWAEAHASLGDISTEAGTDSPGKSYVPWNEGAAHYKEATDWLSVERDDGPPPDRFLALVMRKPDLFTVTLLEKAIKTTQDEQQKAYLHCVIALKLLTIHGNVEQQPTDNPFATHARMLAEFEAALNPGRPNLKWYRDALWQYAEWIDEGIYLKDKRGNLRQFKPDHAKALQLYRRIVNEFQEDKSGRTDSDYLQSVSYRDHALKQIKRITEGKAGNQD